jgi:hypothetical protein
MGERPRVISRKQFLILGAEAIALTAAAVTGLGIPKPVSAQVTGPAKHSAETAKVAAAATPPSTEPVRALIETFPVEPAKIVIQKNSDMVVEGAVPTGEKAATEAFDASVGVKIYVELAGLGMYGWHATTGKRLKDPTMSRVGFFRDKNAVFLYHQDGSDMNPDASDGSQFTGQWKLGNIDPSQDSFLASLEIKPDDKSLAATLAGNPTRDDIRLKHPLFRHSPDSKSLVVEAVAIMPGSQARPKEVVVAKL